MNNKRSCWFHVLYLIGFLVCINEIVEAQISPAATFATSTYSVIPTSSIIVAPLLDPCTTGTDNCDPDNGICTSAGSSYNCSCGSGFTGAGIGQFGCTDINECNSTSSICVSSATCRNELGYYRCICNAGYENSPNCTDVNECNNSTLNKCDNTTSVCVNTDGGFYCDCLNQTTANYERGGTQYICVDTNECSLDNALYCGEATCTNTPVGTYTCSCNTGYTFNSTTRKCDDINECNGNPCADISFSHCTNTIGSYQCNPDPGFQFQYPGIAFSPITDINECSSSPCHSNATCRNTIGNFTCTCNPGYAGNGTFCQDVNECLSSTDNICDSNANCTNTDGAYNCACRSGYSGTGMGNNTCIDINECTVNNPCTSTATCQNLIGSYQCLCNGGYENSPSCTDINECLSTSTNNCHENATCNNTAGSYDCNCKTGFAGSGTVCTDIDECASTVCHTQAACNNTIGNYTCTCRNGFQGDGKTCSDIDECINSPCNQTCTNSIGSYTCSCASGYTFSAPSACIDIDECQNSGTCQANAACANTPGSFTCTCNDGFLEDLVISESNVESKSCTLDRFVPYSPCPFMQNRDRYQPDEMIQIPEGIPFGGVLYYDFYICINGMISVQSDLCHSGPSGNLGDTMINGTVFAPFFADIDLHVNHGSSVELKNRLYYCKYTEVDPQPSGPADEINRANVKIREYVRRTTNFTNFVPRNSIVATWYKVAPYLALHDSVDFPGYFNQGEMVTFQLVMTSDGNNTVVYYVYHEMMWSDNKGFPVMVGSRYNPAVSLKPDPPSQYPRLRFDKANFTNANGNLSYGFVSFQVSDHVETNAVKLCDDWYRIAPKKADVEKLYLNVTNGGQDFVVSNRQASSCPCTLTQALVDDQYVIEATSLYDNIYGCHRPVNRTTSDCEYLSDNTNTCYERRAIHTFNSYFNFNYTVGTRCCYKTKSGSLDTSVSEVPSMLNTQNHFISTGENINTTSEAYARDVKAQRACCLESPLCSRYEARTRVPNCEHYNPPSRSTSYGDPHIMSLDGTQYTFNGLGDYWLLTTNDTDIQLDIQARTCQAANVDGSKSKATVFCGFAFKEKGQPNFEIYYNSAGDPNYYVNGVQKPIASSTEMGTAVIYSAASKELKFIFPSLTVFVVEITSSMLQSVVAASIRIKGKTVGLLGNVDGMSYNDLISRFTGQYISETSTEEQIYHDFGQTWKVSEQESLFSYSHAANLSGYQPLFWTNVTHLMKDNYTLINSTREFCGDVATNKECYFDFALTGDQEMATSGKTFIENSKSIITAVAREAPKVTGPVQINVTRGEAMNFTIEATSNSTNLTYFIVTNYTQQFTLLDAQTGLVKYVPIGSNETVMVGAIDEFSNAGILQVKIVLCDCVHGSCHYDVPELLGNVGKIYNAITQCNCDPGYSGYKCEDFIDSCLLDPCFFNVTCTVFQNRSSGCDPCPHGFSGDGRKCHDIDDCYPVNPCEQMCQNTVGDYTCSCKSGYSKEGKHNCTDINECADTTICNGKANSYCNNTEGSYDCLCKPGYKLNTTSQQCEDVDECALFLDGCQHTCHNTIGSYYCTCLSGTELNADNRTCADINECNQANDCHSNATCTNVYMSYLCECKFGFTGDGKVSCQDVDECNATVRDAIGLTTVCEVDCTNLVGSYKCSCDNTRKLAANNHNCIQKLNPCLQQGQNPCHQNAKCGFDMVTDQVSCVCDTGYLGNGTFCQDDNECSTPNKCGTFSDCTNTAGSFTCACHSGYRKSLDGTTCEEINECAFGTSSCPANSKCVNTQGSYDCNCNSGLVKVNNTCVDINECDTNNGNCGQVCTNTFDSRVCSCNTGYSVNAQDSTLCDDVDECKSSQQCNVNANCENTAGSFRCTCKSGFTGNGQTCSDVNECVTGHSCQQYCNNTAGGYTCSCRSGFRLALDGLRCLDIDECRMGTAKCAVTQACVNQEGTFFCRDKCPGLCTQSCNDTSTGYKCYCRGGYELIGLHTCNDINECQGVNVCHSSGICENSAGSYSCRCPDGYDGNGKTQCIDTNECATNNGGCHGNATCTNTDGSFNCSCFDGFNGNGTYCVDENECNTNDGGCHVNATCINEVGSHSCHCDVGFEGNGTSCADTNECSDNHGGCHSNATCTNLIGSHKCACFGGFDGNGTSCVDINECSTNHGGCHVNATCTNLIGSHKCACFDGFDGNGASCVDRNECVVSHGGCHEDATCNNLVGSHKCICKSGFSGSGTECIDDDECASNNGNCSTNATCTNTAGSYSCSCFGGFSGDGKSCTDINECLNNNGGCHDDATCTNTIGAHTCACKTGYNGTGVSCTDNNECDVNRGGCHINGTCANTPGSFDCTCKQGFDGDGFVCIDKNECINAGHNCHSNATCTNKVGSFVCVCKPGFEGNGENCTDKNECITSNGGCSSNANCTNTFGSRDCSCHTGYSGSGVVCKDILGCKQNNGGCSPWATCTNVVGGATEDCACNEGYTGDGIDCYLFLNNDTIVLPDTSGLAPNSLRKVGTSVVIYDVRLGGVVVDIAGSAAEIRDFSSDLAKRLAAQIQPILLHYYVRIDGQVVNVTVYKFEPLGTGNKRRSLFTTTQPSIRVSYAVVFNVSHDTDADRLATLLKQEVNKTDFQVNTQAFYGKIFPDSIAVTNVDACTTDIATFKHACSNYADCTTTATSYTCKCKAKYSGDGFNCEYVDDQTNFLAAIITTAVGLLLLIILLILFLVFRRRKRDRMDADSTSSASDVSWTPGVFGGMRARSMYTPAGVPPRQYSDDATDDR